MSEGNGDSRRLHILLVEDNPDHVEIIKRAILNQFGNPKIFFATDGQEALNFLFNTPPGIEGVNRLDLIVLDLKLPKVDGYQVLQRVKANNFLRSIPVVVLTTSSRNEDRERTRALGVDLYITKPGQFSGFMAIFEQIKCVLNHKNSS